MVKVIVHARVDNDVYAALRAAAAEQDRTISAVIAKLLRSALIRSGK